MNRSLETVCLTSVWKLKFVGKLAMYDNLRQPLGTDNFTTDRTKDFLPAIVDVCVSRDIRNDGGRELRLYRQL